MFVVLHLGGCSSLLLLLRVVLFLSSERKGGLDSTHLGCLFVFAGSLGRRRTNERIFDYFIAPHPMKKERVMLVRSFGSLFSPSHGTQLIVSLVYRMRGYFGFLFRNFIRGYTFGSPPRRTSILGCPGGRRNQKDNSRLLVDRKNRRDISFSLLLTPIHTPYSKITRLS